VLTVTLGLGAVAGVYLGGRISDRMLGRGVINARILVPLVSLVGVIVTLAPAIFTMWLALAVPLFTLGASFLGATNPPVDAARLDVMHPALWGRAEGIRTLLRSLAEAGAPLLFGWMSVSVFGGPRGLQYTFLACLAALVAAAALAFTALRTYPRDVATAAESGRVQPTEQADAP
jgi:sugar phosphate permease